ncbi:MAG: type VI secretion system baseplate subunit TssK [Anaeromyxobacter sp.]
MRAPQRVIWTEGMFLSPQHLQSQDRYHEALLAARLAALTPFAWGVAELQLDPAALAAGQLRVQRFAGALPDGLWVGFDEGDPEAPPPRALAEAFPPAAKTLDVWLGVARERDGVPAAAAPGGEGPPARYTLGARPVPDAMAPGAPVPVPFGAPATRLLLGAESRDDFDAIRIAEVGRTPAGALALVDTYLPPLLRLDGTPRLPDLLRGLVGRLVSRHRDLAAGRKQREAGTGEVSGADVSRVAQLVVLGGAVPVLSHLAENTAASPREAFLALAGLAGQLAGFSTAAEVAGLPRYLHDDLRATFDPLLAAVNAYLGALGMERYTRIPLEQRGFLHVARDVDEKALHGAQLVLAVKSDLAEVHVAEQLPRLCRIATPTEVQGLVQAAAPGIPLLVLHRPPSEIPVKAGTVYFELGQGDRLWRAVVAEHSLAFHLPPPFDPSRTKVELLSIPRGGGA